MKVKKSLKAVPADKQKSLGKLPTPVRNKMGFQKDGGKTKAQMGSRVIGRRAIPDMPVDRKGWKKLLDDYKKSRVPKVKGSDAPINPAAKAKIDSVGVTKGQFGKTVGIKSSQTDRKMDRMAKNSTEPKTPMFPGLKGIGTRIKGSSKLHPPKKIKESMKKGGSLKKAPKKQMGGRCQYGC